MRCPSRRSTGTPLRFIGCGTPGISVCRSGTPTGVPSICRLVVSISRGPGADVSSVSTPPTGPRMPRYRSCRMWLRGGSSVSGLWVWGGPSRRQPLVSFASRLVDSLIFSWIMSDSKIAPGVRKKVLVSSDHFWRPEDFEGSPEAVSQTLSRLTRSGDLRRIRRGLYWRGSATQLGMAPPPSGSVAMELTGVPGIGPASWSAALALGLSTQVPRHDTVAVPGRAPRNPGAVQILSRAASTKRRDERLWPAEVALLEVLRDWDAFVEVPTHDAVARIGHLVESNTIRVDRLVRASGTEPPRVRERLRRLFVALGRTEDAETVRPARSKSVQDDPVLAV